MTDDMDRPPPPTPESYRKNVRPPMVFVPGAGTMGVGLLVFSLSVLFVSSLLAYLFIRASVHVTVHLHLPSTLWASTAVLLLSSVTMHAGLRAVRQGRESRMAWSLAATMGLGLMFLILQTINGLEIFHALEQSNLAMAKAGVGITGGLKPSLVPVVQTHVLIVAFYVFTGLHALHVIGGLIPLGVVLHRAFKGRYSRNYYPGVRYCSIYWHFLDIIWILIFLTLLATF